MTYHPDFAIQINQTLARLDRSPTWLARRLGVNPSTVSRWLNQGVRPSDPETVVRIADILGLSSQVHELLTAAGYGYVEHVDPGESDQTPLPDSHPSLELQPVSRTILPAPIMPLFGRRREETQLTELLARPDVRLVTITGPGGIGKTRLAQAVAMTQGEAMQDGVFFVRLAPLRRSQDMVTAVAEALDFAFQPDSRSPRQQLLGYLARKQVLLVLDNCEHLMDGMDLAAEILASAPEVVILATSRERLRLTGEAVFPLTGIDYSGDPERASSNAVQLFLHCVSRVRRAYRAESHDLVHIARICRMVAGMPLGILLAAAWMELLSAEEIALQIERSLDFLEADLQDLPSRQRSLRAVFDHSWSLLTEDEQRAFSRLSVCKDGFSLEAAEVVGHASLPLLRALVRKSLVIRADDGRFEIHELLRQYGAEQLARSQAEQTDAVARHADYYLGWLHDLAPDLYGAGQRNALEALDREGENLRLAWEQGAQMRQLERLVGAVRSLSRFYEWYGRFQEGVDACQQAAQALAEETSSKSQLARAQMLVVQARLQRILGRHSETEALFEEVENLVQTLEQTDQDVRALRAALLHERAEQLHGSGSRHAAMELGHQSLPLYQAVGEQVGMTSILFVMGTAALEAGKFVEAESLFEESLRISRSLGGPRETAYALSWLGFTLFHLGRDKKEAERMVRESCTLFQEIGDRAGLARALRDLGSLASLHGDTAASKNLHLRSREIYAELGDVVNVLDTSQSIVNMYILQGKYVEARMQANEALETARAAQQLTFVGIFTYRLGSLALAENNPLQAYELYKEAAQMLEESGWNLIPGIVNAALTLAARRLGRTDDARAHMAHALEQALQGGGNRLGMIVLVAAVLMAAEGQQMWAVELNALGISSLGDRAFPRTRWWWDVAGRDLAAMAESLPAELVAEATARGRGLDLNTAASELLAEFKSKSMA